MWLASKADASAAGRDPEDADDSIILSRASFGKVRTRMSFNEVSGIGESLIKRQLTRMARRWDGFAPRIRRGRRIQMRSPSGKQHAPACYSYAFGRRAHGYRR
jgi:hypothetical protein